MVTTPADTLEAAPQTTSWTVGVGALRRLEVVIPDGHVGLTGFALRWGGRQIVPYEAGEWITGNDDEVHVDLDIYTGVGVVAVVTFNTDDAFPHSHHLRAFVEDLGAAAFVAPSLARVTEGAFGLEPAPSAELTADEVAVLRAAGYDPEVAMPILEQILANTEAILASLGGAAPPVAFPPVEELPIEEAPTVIVPNLVGSTRTAAEEALFTLGLTPNVVEQASTATAGTVIAQDPGPGTEVEQLSTVTITVAIAQEQAPVEAVKLTVPDVVGKTRARAKDILRAAGFTVATEFKVEAGKADVVLKQQPEAGRQRAPGFTVTITVRRNP